MRPKIRNSSTSCKVDEVKEIYFDNVSFSYPDSSKNIISSISFKLAKGDKLLIVGKNGSGKVQYLNYYVDYMIQLKVK